MSKLAISKDFLREYRELDRQVQKRVDEVFDKFTTATHAGLHLEALHMARDPRVRTIRFGTNHRGIVMAPEKGDTYVLVHILPHDEADRWVTRNTFGVNTRTGALEIHEPERLDKTVDALGHLGPDLDAGERPLFAAQADKDFTRLGVPASLVPLLRRLVTEAELDGLAAALPDGQADALYLLAAGFSVDEAWAQLVAAADPGEVDPDDTDAALGRAASKGQFWLPEGGTEELRDVLAQDDFEAWRVFLHPSQRRLAYREAEAGLAPFSGPVRVTGGAGTGKTVVAMHRTRALVDRLDPGERILFTTFTRNLASEIERGLRQLGGPDLLTRVDVLNVDRLAYQVVREAEGIRPQIVRSDEQRDLWRDVEARLGTSFGESFLNQEWAHVVLAQGISSRDGYLRAARHGRGTRLNRRERAEVWKLIEAFTNELIRQGQRTYPQMADAAAGFLDARSVKPYRHVVIDEAQDLHPAQWRMLRAAVATDPTRPSGDVPNNLFIVGDTHQRIYENRVTLSSLGINVRGRSHRLWLNYRTTREILRWSLGLLTGERFDDLDSGEETLAGYRSEMRGREPVVRGFPSTRAEMDALVKAVRAWHDDEDVPLGHIGVAARTMEAVEQAEAALRAAGIPARILTAKDDGRDAGDDPRRPAVELGTMHRMKGLEYRCVAVVDAGRAQIPFPLALTPKDADAVEHRHGLQRERCLLYVACSRARDNLRVSWSGEPSEFLEPLLKT